jgi:hypothetical protein
MTSDSAPQSSSPKSRAAGSGDQLGSTLMVLFRHQARCSNLTRAVLARLGVRSSQFLAIASQLTRP